MLRCKYCGAAIQWRPTWNKKRIPCEYYPIYYIPDANGALTVLTDRGRFIKARRGSEPETPTRIGHLPHSQFCDGARMRRKRNEFAAEEAKKAEEQKVDELKRIKKEQKREEANKKAAAAAEARRQQITFWNDNGKGG